MSPKTEQKSKINWPGSVEYAYSAITKEVVPLFESGEFKLAEEKVEGIINFLITHILCMSYNQTRAYTIHFSGILEQLRFSLKAEYKKGVENSIQELKEYYFKEV